ncbi:MAG TPA: AMP-binding protein [Kaistella chaponensis]|nr:AMP-binding protein [Kaistella chaponensis]
MNIDFSKDLPIKSLFPQTEFEEKVISFLKEWYSDSKTVSVQTSGSTGTPKIFEIEKERMLHSAKMTCDILRLQKGDSALLCLPIEYISGKMMVVRAIERSLKLVIKTPSSTPLSDLNEEIDFCAMSPLQVENSLDQIHFIKNIIIGGAAVSENLKKKITQTLKHSITQTLVYETYGMSETLSHIALKEIFPIPEAYFKVLGNVEISLDERKCLQIFAPKLNPERLQTNDLVELKNEREFRFLGRIDHVINSAGLKIYPEELESLVKKEISNELIFLGIKDERFGQKLILVIEGAKTEMLENKLSTIIYPSKNHHPKEIIFLEKFPRIPNGKIDRRKLHETVDHKD